MVFILCALWWIRIRGLWKLPDGKDWLWGKLGLVLMGGAMLSKSLIQFSVDGWNCVPSLLFSLRPSCRHTPPLETPGHPQAPDSVSCGDTAPFFCLLVHTRFWLCPPKSLFPQTCGSSANKSQRSPKSNSLRDLSPFAGSPGWELASPTPWTWVWGRPRS